MSIQDEARAEAERRYTNRAEVPLTPGATRNARREAFEKGAVWQASRQPEAAPATPVSDTDTRKLIAELRLRDLNTRRHLPDPDAPTLASRAADALELLSRSQPVHVEVTDDMVERASKAIDDNFNPDRYPIMAAMFRDYAHVALSAALGGGE